MLEHVIGRQLRENQRVIIQVETLGNQPVEKQDAARPGKLPKWCNVYKGPSSKQIAEVEEAILQRSELSRPS